MPYVLRLTYQQKHHKEIHLQTSKDKQEKYDRYLAEIFVQQGGTWLNVNDEMVKNGHAAHQDY